MTVSASMDSRSQEPLNSEFELDAFADYYEELSDSFIDIKRASQSLSSLLRPGMTIFEIGLGTGYFAEQLRVAGFDICGIQPRDRMLDRLKSRRPDITLLAEKNLEDYGFERSYDAIVSHSSVFLFTRHQSRFGDNGETSVEMVFQSFLKGKLDVYFNLLKAITALSPAGRLFINVQGNPLPRVEVGPSGDRLLFEMVKCSYDFRLEVVEKLFKASYRRKSYLIRDNRYCCRFADFAERLGCIGGRCSVSKDENWVIISKAN